MIEGISPTGLVEVDLDINSLAMAVELVREGVNAIAICFLFSYLNPAHEQAAARYIAENHPEIFISLSSEVDPGPREYERTVTTVFDSYVKPALSDYLARVEEALASAESGTRFQIVQSRGGSCSAHLARQKPVQLFLSGPAAGVIGAQAAGREAGFENLITIDLGGTSSDLVGEGSPVTRSDGTLGDYRIRVPMVA